MFDVSFTREGRDVRVTVSLWAGDLKFSGVLYTAPTDWAAHLLTVELDRVSRVWATKQQEAHGEAQFKLGYLAGEKDARQVARRRARKRRR